MTLPLIKHILAEENFVLDQSSRLLSSHLPKRICDIAFSICVLLFSLPLFLIIAILIKLDSKGGVFYLQDRVGKDEFKFKLYKFRTMVVSGHPTIAEDYLKDQKFRITGVGKFLRNSGLDELPQFINILKGEMSLVGPRPQPVLQTEYYKQHIPEYTLRHKVKPGLTGLVQISELREHTEIALQKDRLKLDLGYINRWSFWLDVKIIFWTVVTLLPRYNANVATYGKEAQKK